MTIVYLILLLISALCLFADAIFIVSIRVRLGSLGLFFFVLVSLSKTLNDLH